MFGLQLAMLMTCLTRPHAWLATLKFKLRCSMTALAHMYLHARLQLALSNRRMTKLDLTCQHICSPQVHRARQAQTVVSADMKLGKFMYAEQPRPRILPHACCRRPTHACRLQRVHLHMLRKSQRQCQKHTVLHERRVLHCTWVPPAHYPHHAAY